MTFTRYRLSQVLRIESNLEEIIALLRLAIQLDAERVGLDIAGMTMWTYGGHSIPGVDLQNDENGDKLAKSKLLDAMLTFALVHLRGMQKRNLITLSEPDKEIVRQVRNYLAHPEARISWKETSSPEWSEGIIRHQGIVAGKEIRDVDFGYVVGILQLALRLQSGATTDQA